MKWEIGGCPYLFYSMWHLEDTVASMYQNRNTNGIGDHPVNIIRQVLRRFTPVIKEDPVFGTMRFLKPGMWEGRPFFVPFQERIDLALDADESGPSLAQQNLFREIEQRFSGMLESALEALPGAIREWPGKPQEEDLRKDLRFDGIFIEADTTPGHIWSITYYITSIAHYATITFRDWTISNLTIDG